MLESVSVVIETAEQLGLTSLGATDKGDVIVHVQLTDKPFGSVTVGLNATVAP